MIAPLELTGLSRVFPTPTGPFIAVKDVNAVVEAGEFVAILGHSGCGKSTVLSIVAGLDRATLGGVVMCELRRTPWPRKRNVDGRAQRRRRSGEDRNDFVGQQDCFVHTVGNHHRRHVPVALTAETGELALERLAGEGIERAERLVEKHQPGFRGQRPGDGHPLTHPSRQLPRPPRDGVSEPDLVERSQRSFPLLVARELRKRGANRQTDVFERRQPGQQGIVLEYERRIAPDVLQRLSADVDRSRVWCRQSGQQAEER